MGFDVIVNNVKQNEEKSVLGPGSRWGQLVVAAVCNYNITYFC